ncbi:MAG: DnaA regulatory inactivator Hda [Halioglobus sp.]|nr:DnaA regulatory inactivator Hda [Halioglobus sp.]
MATIGPTGEQVIDSGHQQLPLAVRLRDEATFGNFLPVDQIKPLLNALQQQLQPSGEAIIYLYGSSGTGKSHLLQANCHADSAQTLYLPLAELGQFPPGEVLQGLAGFARLCLDDVQTVLTDAGWERALFNLINGALQQDCRLVISGDAAPRVLHTKLADLRSRLSGAIVFQLSPLDDDVKAAILRFRAGRRGMKMSPSVASYIVKRAPRAMGQLLGVLDQLDTTSLVEKRSLSVPFVKAVMGW